MKHSSDNPPMDLQHATKGSEIFIGGLPSTITETKIHEVFAACGEIVEIRLIKDHSGKPKGYCFVRFAMKEAAIKAIKEKSGFMIEGKKIGVLPSTEQCSLFLGNLRKGERKSFFCAVANEKNWSTDDLDKLVRQAFQDVVSVDLAMSLNSEACSLSQKLKNRGFAFVKFSSHAAAARAYRIGSKADFVLCGNWHPSVEWAQEDPEVDPEELAKVKIAFVKNLPVDADEDYLRKLFESFGKLEKVVLSKKSRCPVGFVYFDKRSGLDHAIEEMNGRTIRGPKRGPEFKIQVEVARPMDKTKKRTHDESQRNPTSKTPSFSYQLCDSSGFDKSKAMKLELRTEEAHVGDAYEAAVILLPVAVKERLLRILRLGIATRFDIDIQFITSLGELPESAAISVLDQFLISGADKQNKGAFLAGLISKYKVKVDNVGLNQNLMHLSRAGEITIRDPTLPTLFDRVHLPAADSLASLAGRTTSRYNIYDITSPLHSRLSPSHLDHPVSHRMDVRRMEETSPVHAFRRHGSPVSYSRVEIDSHFTPAARQPVSPLTYRKVELDSHLTPAARQPVSSIRYDNVGLDSHLAHAAIQPPLRSHDRVRLDSHISSSSNHEPSRPQNQVRFDPFTGEPYKFDPFTGEPIQPKGLNFHPGSLY